MTTKAMRAPETIRSRAAAAAIGCHYETVRDYVTRGVFTAVRPLGFGRGKPFILYRDEVEAFVAATGDKAAAVLALRKKLGRLPKN